MYVMQGYASLFLPYCSNLKQKRKIINSIIGRIRNRFNISIAEVDAHDLWQRTTIGFAAVANQHHDTELFIQAIESTLERFTSEVEIIEFKYDIIKVC